MILCVCAGGNVRSVTLARLFKDRGEDAIAAGALLNSDATLKALGYAADRVIVVGEAALLDLLPPGLAARAEHVDVGQDVWGAPMADALVRLLHDALPELGDPPPAAGPTVGLGFIHGGTWRAEFGWSLLALDRSPQLRCIGDVIGEAGPYIPDNRNRVHRRFVEDTDLEWLWWLDIDIAFPPDIIDALLHHADPIERPILGALYFNRMGGANSDGNWFPCWLRQYEDLEMAIVPDVTIGDVVPLTTVGLGCTLIHRSVIEAVGKAHEQDPWPWFGHDVVTTPDMGITRVGEDITFCRRARNLGFPVHGLSLPVDHIKTDTIGWHTFVNQCDRQAAQAKR